VARSRFMPPHGARAMGPCGCMDDIHSCGCAGELAKTLSSFHDSERRSQLMVPGAPNRTPTAVLSASSARDTPWAIAVSRFVAKER
jgi:hypothetical protein